MPYGIKVALFGRMVTSDPAANKDAAIHVAHAGPPHGPGFEVRLPRSPAAVRRPTLLDGGAATAGVAASPVMARTPAA